MYSGKEIIGRVIDKVQDDSLAYQALSQLNNGLLAVSGLVLLSKLQQVSNVLTIAGKPSVPLPAGFSRGLFGACPEKDLSRRFNIVSSRASMVYRFGNMQNAGHVNSVCATGGALLYQNIPSKPEVLVLFYYRKPMPILDNDNDIDGFDDNVLLFGTEAIYNYACWMLYDQIEDGIEGRKVNTEFHRGEFLRNVMLIKTETKDISRPAPPVTRGPFL